MIKYAQKQQFYVISAMNAKGAYVFLGGESSRPRMCSNPAEAFLFDIDTDKAILVSFLDRYKTILSKHDADSISFMVYETGLQEVDVTEYEWATALQRNAVKKLSIMEIKALGVEKYEIERRLS